VSKDAPTPAQPAIARRHVTAAVIGNALECYDFLTYAFFAVQIGRVFYPTQTPFISLMLSLATFGAGFVSRPLGALLLGAYADRVGRRPAMLASFAMMGGAIVVMALTPGYARIGAAAPLIMVAARLIQGLAIGGEIGTTTTYLVEAVAANRRGFSAAWQYAGQGMAALVAGLLGVVLANSISPGALQNWGWRLAFLIGAAVLPIGLWIRRDLPETLHRPEPAVAGAATGGFLANARIITLGLVIIMSTSIHFYVLNFMTTYAASVLHMKANLSFAAPAVFGVSTIIFSLAGGALSDRFGRRPMMIWPRVALLIAIYPAYALIAHYRDATSLLAATLVLTMLGQLSGAASLTAVTESLPKPIRGTSLAVLYATATAIFGGTTQPAVTWLIHRTGDVLWPGWYLMIATAIGLGAMLLMKESAPAKLQSARP
jgi:MFS family permease